MQALTEKVWRLQPPGGLFDKTVVGTLFPDASVVAKKSSINKALRKGEIIRLAPSSYCLSREFRQQDPHPFAIAAQLCGPSYVTLESALAYHDLIPEAVRQVSCGIPALSRTFTNAFGRFDYFRILCDPFMANIFSVKLEEKAWAFVAGPVRAIADMVYLRKEITCNGDCLAFLTDSLRIELPDLQKIPAADFDRVRDGFANNRVRKFLDIIKKEVCK